MKLINPFSLSFSVALSGFSLLLAQSSQAAIIGGQTLGGWLGDAVTKRDIEILSQAPSSMRVNINESLSIQAFTERQQFSLPSDITVDTGFRDSSTGSTILKAGTLVNSYLLFLDPPQAQRKSESPGKAWTAKQWGYVQFDIGEKILGIWSKHLTDKTTKILGSPTTTYEAGRLLDSGDRATFNGTVYNYEYTRNQSGKITKQTLWEYPKGSSVPESLKDINVVGPNVLNFYFSTTDGIDPVRVITNVQPVPEPLTMLGAATALGFGTLFKRNLTKKTKAD